MSTLFTYICSISDIEHAYPINISNFKQYMRGCCKVLSLIKKKKGIKKLLCHLVRFLKIDQAENFSMSSLFSSILFNFFFLTKDWIHSWKPILYSFILCWVGEKIKYKMHVTLYIFKLGKMTAELKMVDEVYGVGLVGNNMYCEWFMKFKINLTLRTNLSVMTCKPHSMNGW